MNPKTKSSAKQSKKPDFEKTEDGAINFTINIPSGEVDKAYKKAVSFYKKEIEVKGFRKGKAPDKLVEEQVGKQKLYTQALEYLLPDYYQDKIQKLNIKPIVHPRIVPEKLEEGKDWQLKVTVAEMPEIKLDDYKKSVTGIKTADKLWVPGKDDSTNRDKIKDRKESVDARLSKIFDILLQQIKFPLPTFLVDEQVNRDLSRLLEQIQKLGLNLESYLTSINKTAEQLRNEYREQAARSLRLEFILNEIAKDLKITVFEEEIDELINSIGDQKLKEKIRSSASERGAIRESLKKRKVTDELLKM